MTETQYLARPEGRIAFEVRGSGPLVIAAPGMGVTRSTYSAFADELVDAGFTVALTDLRGHGESDATFDHYGSTATADDLVALAEHLGARAGEPAVLVGNSMSAGSAVLVASRRPELVSALVLLGPAVRNVKIPVLMRALFRLLMLPPWSSAAWIAFAPTLYAGTRPESLDEQLDELRRSLRRPGAARALRATTRTTHDQAEEALPTVSAPSLVVMGDRDPDFPDPSGEASWIAETIGRDAAVRPASEVVMVEQSGHYPHAQHPVEVARAVTAFLAREAADA